LLLQVSFSLTFDDVAIAVHTSEAMMADRIIPMLNGWYQLVPEVHICADWIPEDLWPSLLANNRPNLIFHTNNGYPHYVVGTRYDLDWNGAQSRHLSAISDLYNRFPDRNFYFICDDDTFVLPSNLLSFLETVDIHTACVYSYNYAPPIWADQLFVDYPRIRPEFSHGGSGIILTQEIMRTIAPHLPACSAKYESPNLGSDIRLAACANHLTWEGARLANDNIHIHADGLNPDLPERQRQLLADRRQATFHSVFGEVAVRFFDAAVTLDDQGRFWDWAHLAFRPMRIQAGPRHWFHCIMAWLVRRDEDDDDGCVKAVGGIVRKDYPLANFSQRFNDDFVAYYRCSNEMLDDEFAYFGEPLAGEEGMVIELKCPEPQPFVVRSNGTMRIIEEFSDGL
jgi:hypothetical protein